MHLLFMFLADAAEVANGKLYVMGGGWSQLHPHVLAGVHPAFLVIGIGVEPTAANTKHTFSVTLQAGGQVTQIRVGEFGVRRVENERIQQHTCLMAVPVQLPLSHQGECVLTLAVNGQRLGSVSYDVTPVLAQRLGVG